MDLDLDGCGTALFAVFDGHAGGEVARFCARHLVRARGRRESAAPRCQAAASLLGTGPAYTATRRPALTHSLRPCLPHPHTHPPPPARRALQPQELLRQEAYQAGDLPAALSAAFLSVDQLMCRPEPRAELCALREGTAKQQPEVVAAQVAAAAAAAVLATGSSPAGISAATLAAGAQGPATVAALAAEAAAQIVPASVAEALAAGEPATEASAAEAEAGVMLQEWGSAGGRRGGRRAGQAA